MWILQPRCQSAHCNGGNQKPHSSSVVEGPELSTKIKLPNPHTMQDLRRIHGYPHWNCRPAQLPARRPVTGQRVHLHVHCTAQPASGEVRYIDDLEEARKYRRPVFDFAAWAEHRAVSRYNKDMQGILTSRIVRGLAPPLLYTAAGALAVSVYETLQEAGYLAQLAPGVPWPDFSTTPDGPFSISTFALSLLLVFRTNSSYERWWEAMTAWSLAIQHCCHLASQVVQWLPGPSEADAAAAMLRWLRVYPLALMCHVREDHQLQQEVKGLLLPEEEALLLSSSCPPLTVLSALGRLVTSNPSLRIETKTHWDESLRELQHVYATCHKILTTPIPLSYTRHTTRFLVVWLTAMPYCVWAQLHWFTVPISVVVAFLLLAIEEIGIQLEEPHGVMAVESMCDKVRDHIQRAVQEKQQLQQLYPDQPISSTLAALPPATPQLTRAAAVEATTHSNGHSQPPLQGWVAPVSHLPPQ